MKGYAHKFIIFGANKRIMGTKNFKINNTSIDHLSIEILKLYYESAQDRIHDYHKQANDTTNRAYQLIAVYIGVLSLLCKYLYVNWDITTPIMAILALTLGTALATIVIFAIIFPRLYVPLGRSPKELQPEMYAQYFAQNKSISDEMKLKQVLKDELEILQLSIDTQGRKNKKRTFLFTLSLLFAICGIIASVWIMLI